MSGPVIALLTDFGGRDTYVGEVKGAILTVHPGATIVDITHAVPPQDVAAGAWMLADAAPAFPPGAVFVAVVDPGVGTSRRAVAVETPRGLFLAPDNGLLTRVVWDDAPPDAAGDAASTGGEAPTGVAGVAPQAGDASTEVAGLAAPPEAAAGASPVDAPTTVEASLAALPAGVRAWRLSRPEYWRPTVSHTFHGRDVFAPSAAHLALGVPPSALGEPVGTLLRLPLPTAAVRDGVLTGEVVYVDQYGNLVTNIAARSLPTRPTVEVGGARIDGLSGFYDTSRRLVAMAGSHGWLEVVAPGGSASATLGVGRGAPVRVREG